MQTSLRRAYFLILLLIGLLNCQQLFSSVREPWVVDPIFMPVIFTGKLLPEGYLTDTLNISPTFSDIGNIIPNNMVLNVPSYDMFEEKKRERELNRKAYLYLITIDPFIVKHILPDLPKADKVKRLEVNTSRNLFKIEHTDLSPSYDLTKIIFRQYWFVDGNHLLQFSQNYISANWVNGGVGNLNFLSKQSLRVRYEKSKVQFNSLLEWNTSFFTSPNDSLRKTRIGTDLLRSYSNFGFKACNRWYYSTNLELRTQMFNNYEENSRTKISSFISPFSLNMGLGMRYELEKKFKSDKYKLLKLTADLSPISVKHTFVNNPKVDPTRYGIPEGKNCQTFYGSTVNATVLYNVNSYTSLKTRLKYFTSYDKVEIESENELNFSINRYFSTRIYLYVRFDDSENIPQDPKLGYFQLNELLSFGFNYRW